MFVLDSFLVWVFKITTFALHRLSLLCVASAWSILDSGGHLCMSNQVHGSQCELASTLGDDSDLIGGQPAGGSPTVDSVFEVPIVTGARRGKPSLNICAVTSAKELATESEAKRQKLEEEKKMMDEILENVQVIMRAMNAQTVSAIGAISTELAPKLDLMTAKIDENNKTMNSHKKDYEDVERNLKLQRDVGSVVLVTMVTHLVVWRCLAHELI